MPTGDPYEVRAAQFYDRFRSVPAQSAQAAWLDLVPQHPCLTLDVGAGSGRDAEWLHSLGHEVVAVEPSAALRSLAERDTSPGVRWLDDSCPALAKVYHLNLAFDVILVSAVWMHIVPGDRERTFRKLADLLRPGGILVISVRDQPFEDDRPYHPTSTEELKHLGWQHLLQVVREAHSQDFLGRPEVTWTTLVFRLPDDGTGALPLLRHVVINDPKSSTYKLALLRVLARIADSGAGLAVREGEDAVSVPLGLVALYWVRMFKRLLLDVPTPLRQHPNPATNLGFARAGFNALRGISPYDLRLGTRVNEETAAALHAALRDAARTIAEMPVTHITYPYADRPVFEVQGQRAERTHGDVDADYLASFGRFIIPAAMWTALANYACWIEPVIVMEWCKLMSKYERQDPATWADPRYLQALQWLDPEHNTGEVRGLVMSLRQRGEQVFCVWSGRRLTEVFDIDHCFPFAFWPNNDLWNLLPAHPSVNRGRGGKSGRLVTARALEDRRQPLVDWWRSGYVGRGLGHRFFEEAKAALPSLLTSLQAEELTTVFEGVQLQRMILRRNQQIAEWEP